MYKGLSKKDARIAKHYESITDKKIKEEQRWAEENGLVVKGPIGISQAVATLKDRRKRMVSMRLDPENIEGMKEWARVEGVPYQTLINSVLHRFLNGDLVSKDSLKTAV